MTYSACFMGRIRPLFRPLLLGALLSLALTAPAQVGGGYELTWSTIDGGAAVATGAGYTLTGIAGQPEVAPAATGGGYTLAHGFLQPSDDPPTRVAEWALY